jgi:glycosyltransferase involved in cell wall biosynthesis
MRIGVNCFLLQENIGGLRQYFLRLFRELLLNDIENSYVFFYFRHNIEELKNLGTDNWKKGAILLNDQNEINKHFDKIDVYFCPFGALWPRPVPKPSVVSLVDIQEKFFPQFFTPLDLWNRDMHYKPSTKVADQVITISEFSKNSFAKFHRISRDKIHVVYLAADEFFYSTGTKNKEASIPLPKKYIFYPANKWLHKNHDNLLKALVILKREQNLIVDCVLTGFDYPTGYPLKKKVETYELTKQVHDLGYISLDDLKYTYQNASLLCFPSFFEGFGMPLLEAMAYGCPVTCSNVTSIPEVVGDAALFFNPHDPEDIARCILKLLSDEDSANRLRKKGAERAKKFSQSKSAAKHLEVFKMATASYRKRRYFYYRYLNEPVHRIRMIYKRKLLERNNKALES